MVEIKEPRIHHNDQKYYLVQSNLKIMWRKSIHEIRISTDARTSILFRTLLFELLNLF